ncbi:MAG: right-handed parallel beta-helix repeat-containing protein [Armatimonadetes bacterium]|nr:right-handed parallel beta-helix repeat-containing protein [Armatimonadota bacterium]
MLFTLREYRRLTRSALFACCFIATGIAQAANWYVSPTGNDSNLGTSGSPFKSIQKGVTVAGSGDTIFLLPGTYSGSDNRGITIATSNLTIASTGGSATTIIDGSNLSNGSFIVNAPGCQFSGLTLQNDLTGIQFNTTGSTVTNCVIKGSGLSTLQGTLTLTNSSYVQNSSALAVGGGTCTLSNCLLDGNTNGAVNVQAGGALNAASCVFTNNISGNGGAIRSASNSGISLTDCKFYYNSGSSGGGAVYISGSGTSSVTRCEFNNNASSGDGGAMNSASICTIQQSKFKGNTAVNGGAISANGGPLTVTGSYFGYNSSTSVTGGGGAIKAYAGSLTFQNCQFIGNASNNFGGAIDDGTTRLEVDSSTFTANYAAIGGGAIFKEPFASTHCYLTNDILWGDRVGQTNKEIDVSDSTQMQIQYCDLYLGWVGTGNLNVDPRFLNTANGDYHLMPGTPCFGAGTPFNGIVTDYDGNQRHANPTMGAYEALSGGGNWAPIDAAVGADGQDRVLWQGINGLAGYTLLYRVANPGGPTYHVYSTPGYVPIKIASGPNGHDRMLLLNSTNGTVLLYDIASDFSITNYKTYGPFTGWTPWLMSVDANNNAIITWRNANGQVSVWSVATNGVLTYNSYGPFNDGSGNLLWSVVGTSITAGGTDILWQGQNGVAGYTLLWRNAGASYNAYGPFANWNSALFAVGPNGDERVLFNDGAHDIALWDVASNYGVNYASYGPFATWTPMAMSVDSNNAAHIMYASSSGAVLLWTVSTNGNIVYGVYGPY